MKTSPKWWAWCRNRCRPSRPVSGFALFFAPRADLAKFRPFIAVTAGQAFPHSHWGKPGCCWSPPACRTAPTPRGIIWPQMSIFLSFRPLSLDTDTDNMFLNVLFGSHCFMETWQYSTENLTTWFFFFLKSVALENGVYMITELFLGAAKYFITWLELKFSIQTSTFGLVCIFVLATGLQRTVWCKSLLLWVRISWFTASSVHVPCMDVTIIKVIPPSLPPSLFLFVI